MDWSAGRYEPTAKQLEPAAREVVKAAQLKTGERVLDLGCGTGNAALVAAAAGAEVVGVDPAGRLLEVARKQAGSGSYQVEPSFIEGDATAIPLADGSVQTVLSVFAVIFCPDPIAAAKEIMRVLTDSGQILITAWQPIGVHSEIFEIYQDVQRQAGKQQEQKDPPFAWHRSQEVQQLFADGEFQIATKQHQITFQAASVENYVQRFFREHPLWMAAVTDLGSTELSQQLEQRITGHLEQHNESKTTYKITSSYVVHRLTKDNAGN